jgi:peptide/nickel transport system permease protein
VLDTLRHLLLPGVAMGLASAAGVARYMRSSMLEVIRQDFVRTARAKGLPERVVLGRHALRNALLPILTLMGLSLPALVGGSVLVETVFAWPGMGRLIVDAVQQQDTPVIVACFLLFSTLVAAGNLLADALVAVADPRIRVQA